VQAPGRINLIGEHTDYNDGFVFPMAIDRRTVIASRRRPDDRVRVFSEGFGEAGFGLPARERSSDGWAAYLEGVAWALGMQAGSGWEGAIVSTIPRGAGLSSSAALEVGAALTFTAHTGAEWDPVPAALACQRAENEWVGMQSGIMDQLIAAIGRAGHASLIDCRDLSTGPYPLPDATRIVILDTSTRRELTTSAYNDRRAESAAGAGAFGVASLRDLETGDLDAPPAGIDPVVLRRVRHVVTENARTLAAAEAMSAGDAARLGQLMNESHASLRDDYEVSSPALDAMATAARSAPGCFGARQTGGGFAGCAIALVDAETVESFSAGVAAAYREATGLTPAVYPCQAADGASVVTP
jgi:galactokinase